MTLMWKNTKEILNFIFIRKKKKKENETYNEMWFIFKQTNNTYAL